MRRMQVPKPKFLLVVTIAIIPLSLVFAAGSSQRPDGLVNNAASAAAAAAAAANAAAVAAKAAADAAGAALRALEAIQPSLKLQTSPTPVATSAPPTLAIPDPEVEDSSSLPQSAATSTSATQFPVPTERTLVGLAGVYELPVAFPDQSDSLLPISGPPRAVVELNLRQAIEAGLIYSRDVLAAQARREQADAQSGQARAALLPSATLRLNGGLERSNPKASSSTDETNQHQRNDANFTLRQPIFDRPAQLEWDRREQLGVSRQKATQAVRGDAYVAVVNAYVNLAATRMQVSMAEEFEGQLSKLFDYIQKRATAGAASASDASRVRARSLSAKSSRLEQEASYASAALEFIRLTHLQPKMLRLPTLDELNASVLPTSVEEALNQALENNPDVASLKKELAAAETDVRAAQARYMPRFDVEYTNTMSNHAQGDPGRQKDSRLMLVMNWNLFSGGGDKKIIDEKKARRDEVRYRLENQQLQMRQNLSVQFATLAASRQRLTLGYRELTTLARAATSMNERMFSGNQSLLDLLDVQERYFQARNRLVTLHAQEITVIAQINRLLGDDGERLVPVLASSDKTGTAPSTITQIPVISISESPLSPSVTTSALLSSPSLESLPSAMSATNPKSISTETEVTKGPETDLSDTLLVSMPPSAVDLPMATNPTVADPIQSTKVDATEVSTTPKVANSPVFATPGQSSTVLSETAVSDTPKTEVVPQPTIIASVVNVPQNETATESEEGVSSDDRLVYYHILQAQRTLLINAEWINPLFSRAIEQVKSRGVVVTLVSREVLPVRNVLLVDADTLSPIIAVSEPGRSVVIYRDNPTLARRYLSRIQGVQPRQSSTLELSNVSSGE